MTKEKEQDLKAGYRKIKAFRKMKKRKKDLAYHLKRKARELKLNNYGTV